VDLSGQICFYYMKKIFSQFLKSIFSGAVSSLLDLFLLWFLTSILGVYYLISSALSFILSTFLNYLLNISFVFNERKIFSKKIEISGFFLISILTLFLTQILMFIFVEKFKIFYLFAKIIIIFLVFLFNFSLRRIFLFK